jgi:hypothetical protein
MLNLRRVLPVVFLSFAAGPAALAADFSVKPVEGLPEGVGEELAKSLSPKGYQVTGADGPHCRIWFVSEPETKEGFSPTLSVKYPFAPGSLVGMLQVEQGSSFTDFREQNLAPGLYTLRYAEQPQDGNHIGTSDLSDFLLALQAKTDSLATSSDNVDEAVALSQDAAGSTHPAILSLRPPGDAVPKEARIEHDSADDFHILEAAIGSREPTALRLVVAGFALE